MKLLNEVYLLILLLCFITNSSSQRPPLTFDSSLKNLSNGTNGQDRTATSQHSQTNSIIVMIPSTIRNSEAFVRSQKSLLNQLATLNLDRTVNSPQLLIQYRPNIVQNQRPTSAPAKPKPLSKQSMVNRGVSSIGQEPLPTTSSSSKTIDNSLKTEKQQVPKVMKSFSSVDIKPNDTIVSVDIVTTTQSVAVNIPTSTPKPPVEATKTTLTRKQRTGEIPEPGDAVVPPWAAALDLDPPENLMSNPYSMASNFWFERNYPQYPTSNFHYEQYPYYIKQYSAPRYRTSYRKRLPMIKGFSRDDVLRRPNPERIKQYEASNDFGVIGKADALPVQKYPNVPTRPFPKYQDIYVRQNSVPGAFQRVYIGEQRPHEVQPQQSRSTIDSINSQNTYKYPSFPPPPPPSFPVVSALDFSPLLEQPDVLYLPSHYKPPMYVPYQEPTLESMPYIYNPQHAISYGQPSLILDSIYGLDTTSNAVVLTDEKVFQKAKSAIQSSLAIGVDKNTNSSPAKNTIFSPRRNSTSSHSWGYRGNVGPSNWPMNYELCSGTRQSPINIDDRNVIYSPDLGPFTFNNFDGRLSNFTVKNNGHTASISCEGNLFVENGGFGGKYETAEIHFHWGSNNTKGSEHALNGRKFPLEMHIVNFAAKYGTLSNAMKWRDGLGVLGVFFELGAPNPGFDKIEQGLEQILTPGESVSVGSINVLELLPLDRSRYFRYYGSLTTPPCYQSVLWTIFEDRQTISFKQLEALRKLYETTKQHRLVNGQMSHPAYKHLDGDLVLVDNFRPLQPAHGRLINTNIRRYNDPAFLKQTQALPRASPSSLNILQSAPPAKTALPLANPTQSAHPLANSQASSAPLQVQTKQIKEPLQQIVQPKAQQHPILQKAQVQKPQVHVIQQTQVQKPQQIRYVQPPVQQPVQQPVQLTKPQKQQAPQYVRQTQGQETQPQQQAQAVQYIQQPQVQQQVQQQQPQVTQQVKQRPQMTQQVQPQQPQVQQVQYVQPVHKQPPVQQQVQQQVQKAQYVQQPQVQQVQNAKQPQVQQVHYVQQPQVQYVQQSQSQTQPQQVVQQKLQMQQVQPRAQEIVSSQAEMAPGRVLAPTSIVQTQKQQPRKTVRIYTPKVPTSQIIQQVKQPVPSRHPQTQHLLRSNQAPTSVRQTQKQPFRPIRNKPQVRFRDPNVLIQEHSLTKPGNVLVAQPQQTPRRNNAVQTPTASLIESYFRALSSSQAKVIPVLKRARDIYGDDRLLAYLRKQFGQLRTV